MQQSNTHYTFPSKLLVTGTDTGIGKTTVSIALAKLAERDGFPWAYFKPAESGEPSESDATRFSQSTGAPDRVHVAYRLRRPLAPRFAAEAEGVIIEKSVIERHVKSLEGAGRLIVEGAGGILVPYGADFSMLELAREQTLSALIVVGNRLGCLNHALLTIAVLRQTGVPIVGCVFNDVADDTSVTRNVTDFRKLSDVPVLAWLPRLSDGAVPDAEWWDRGIKRLEDLG